MNEFRRHGSAEVHRIVDIDPFPLALNFLFPGASVEALGEAGPALSGDHIDLKNGTALLAIQSHLVRFGGKTILIDACVGEHKQRPARPDWHLRAGSRYLANLAACGCAPDDIDIVMCTHLHADHVGWNTRLQSGQWIPTFGKARYLMSQREIDQRAGEAERSATANHGSFQDSVLPVIERGLVTTVDEGDEIADGAKIVALPGHAPGQIGLDIRAGQDEHLLFCGDAIHNPVQVYHPGWSSAFCHDKSQAAQTRMGLIERAAAENITLIPAHLRAGSMGVRERSDGYRPVFED